MDVRSAVHLLAVAVLATPGLCGHPHPPPAVTSPVDSRPRCGVSDPAGSGRAAAYRTNGYRWSRPYITYTVSRYPASPPPHAVDGELRRAFATWSAVSPLRFRRVDATSDAAPDVTVAFVGGNHGDGFPFDGKDGVLGHAVGPPGAFLHLDDDEEWGVGGEGTDLYQVAVHEVGHVLGLSHSGVDDAVMDRYAKPYDVNFRLHSDDIRGIQALYGSPDVQSVTSQTPSSPHPKTRPCTRAFQVDAMMNVRGTVLLFSGTSYYRLSGWPLKGSPHALPTTRDFPGGPPRVDAALARADGRRYLFADGHVFRYERRRGVRGYARTVGDAFPGIPERVDAAVRWPGRDRPVFFRDGQLWVYDGQRRPQVAARYPLPARRLFRGFPGRVDAAVVVHNLLYLVKGGAFVTVNATSRVIVDRGRVADWFGCPKSS